MWYDVIVNIILNYVNLFTRIISYLSAFKYALQVDINLK